MNVLITGNKGFIGSNIKVNVIGAINRGWDIKYEDKDINDDIPGKYDTVIHCAAEMFDKDKMMWTNYLGTLNIVKHCLKWGARLIHLSTVSVYGDGMYGYSKKMAENVVEKLRPKGCILRLTNVYGPGGSSPANRFEQGENVIFGDGSHVKDHVHLNDVVRAINMAINDEWEGTINIASGAPMAIKDVFERFGKGEPVYEKDRKPDIDNSILGNGTAFKLGWKPTWSIYDKTK